MIVPPAAESIFGVESGRAARYAELLATTGVQRGLVGPREADRLWDRHLLNCGVLSEAIPWGVRACDVGSGAGLPGIVVALNRPDVEVVLLEPMLRRVTFLNEVRRELGLSEHVRVVRGRAEDHRGEYEIVVARAVARLDRLVQWCRHLLAPGGSLLAVKGAQAGAEVRSTWQDLTRLGVWDCAIEEYGGSVLDRPTTVVRVRMRS